MTEKEHEKLETRVALLEKDVDSINNIFKKFDNTINKLFEAADNLNRASLVHEEKFKGIYHEIESVKKDIVSIERGLEGFNKMKWIIMGAAAVVGWLISKINFVDILHKL